MGRLLCDGFFKAWVELLEPEPEWWMIRDVRRGLVWRSPALLRAYGYTPHGPAIGSWEERLRWIHEEDVELVEDAHSAALKSRAGQWFRFRARMHPREYTWMNGFVMLRQCSHCPSECGLIIGCVELADGEEVV